MKENDEMKKVHRLQWNMQNMVDMSKDYGNKPRVNCHRGQPAMPQCIFWIRMRDAFNKRLLI